MNRTQVAGFGYDLGLEAFAKAVHGLIDDVAGEGGPIDPGKLHRAVDKSRKQLEEASPFAALEG